MDQRAFELVSDHGIELAATLARLGIGAGEFRQRAGMPGFNIWRYFARDGRRTIMLDSFFGIQLQLGREVAERREKLGITRGLLATMIGSHPHVVQLLEDGLVYSPSLIRSVAEVLKGVELERQREQRRAARSAAA